MQQTPRTAKSDRPKLPQWVVALVWARAAGRCEFLGCNRLLWRDELTNTNVNTGYIAHNISWTQSGPRGDPTLSAQLARDPSNLLLMCNDHHSMIDADEHKDKFTVELLRDFGRMHEERIETLTAIDSERRTTILLVQASIGTHAEPIREDHARLAAVQSGRYPQKYVLPIDLTKLGPTDANTVYWPTAAQHLSTLLRSQIDTARHLGSLDHLSVFALGPIPLLIHLGRELGDKIEAEVFNLHRSPKGWRWPRDGRQAVRFEVIGPSSSAESAKEVALSVSVSSSVQVDHLAVVLPTGTPLFEIRVDEPQIELVRDSADVAGFVRAFRQVMERIHDGAPLATKIHLFAAVPVALAVELGRALLPKLHAPLALYDYNRATCGWTFAIEIGVGHGAPAPGRPEEPGSAVFPEDHP